jgi:hypothetical protein
VLSWGWGWGLDFVGFVWGDLECQRASAA